MYSPYYTDPAQRLAQIYPQTIQTLQGLQPQVQCYFVSSPNDLSSIQVQLNTVYIGLNNSANEIYVRQLNNDGNIDFRTYKLLSGTQEQTDMKSIVSALEEIKSYIKGGFNEPNATTVSPTIIVRQNAEQSSVPGIQPNDGGQEPAGQIQDSAQRGQITGL